MLSRAYFCGVHSLEVLKIPVIHKVLNLQKADGSFGGELLTALAVCTLLNFNYHTPNLDKAIDFLFKTQQSNGSWRRVPMYGGQADKELFGSAELTTALCVEALARYRLLDIAGNMQQRQNRFCDAMPAAGEAIASYQTALQFHPNNFEIHLELAKTLEKEKKWHSAIASYRRAIELNLDYSWSHKHLGDILAEQGQINEASVCYRRALQLQPRIF